MSLRSIKLLPEQHTGRITLSPLQLSINLSSYFRRGQARDRFDLGSQYRRIIRNWQERYSDDIHLSLQAMSGKERTDVKALEKRIKELEKQLELAKMKNVGLNTIIDIAEQDYKLEIRKKSGPKQ
ncbi:hypothetical protein [Prolixibacter sp. NT017]|uniref:hypothetical protein n=1 Tax=Prolixibacter sp. NT017 TaxID=2652390 RepID=UPI00126B7CC7|nr:hypothetical protein [Prolixibacter sp. NT017]GET25031.1 hypothetical protein NT017_13600 [Prolixibacter sp. NT017]